MADWSDFETLRSQVKYNTVDRLKSIVTGLNEQCGTHITKGGKKQDLIDKILDKMDTWRQSDALDKWVRLRPILLRPQARDSGQFYRDSSSGPFTPTSSSIQRPQSLSTYANSSNVSKLPAQYDPYSATNYQRSSGIYDPYAPPRKIQSQSPGQSHSKLPTIRFKASPFFKLDSQISSVVECPESASSTDRRSQSLMFSLQSEVVQKLRSESPKYQLRLYCTSSQFYNQGPHVFRPQTSPCPIEFPPTCEVRVNSIAISANLKGMKKKPGTAPPGELPFKSLQLDHAGNNQRVDMIYVNSQQPVQVKKYYMTVFLVEVSTAAQLVERLKRGMRISEEESKRRMKASAPEDEDVVIGEVKISLKCPLTYMRIRTACRSSQCSHPQCFDALSWYQLMEQTTTWLCPVCEKVINPDDLILDGYFESILNHVLDEDVENVMIEPSGEWHTSDNIFCSQGWVGDSSRQATVNGSVEHEKQPTAVPRPLEDKYRLQSTECRKVSQHVYSLCDSDDEEESVVTRELSRISSPRRSSPSTGGTSVAPAPVIDLTLDSDDDRVVPATQTSRVDFHDTHRLGEKRKRALEDNGSTTAERRVQLPVALGGGSSSTRPSARGYVGDLNQNHFRHDNMDVRDRHTVSLPSGGTYPGTAGIVGRCSSNSGSFERSSLRVDQRRPTGTAMHNLPMSGL